MATTKTFTVVGVSTLNGITKVRWANDFVARIKILAKDGHTDIDLIQLDQPMNKVDALKQYLNERGDQLSPDANFAVTTRIEDIEAKQKKNAFKLTRKPSAKVESDPELSLDAIRARAKA